MTSNYDVRVVPTSPSPVAVVREVTTWDDLPTVWPKLLDRVWSFLGDNPEIGRGHNVMIYDDDRPTVRIGVQVDEPFDGDGPGGLGVECSTLPGGDAAMAEHIGAYAGLRDAHEAVRSWCESTGRAVTGVRWEVYGDWDDDPSRLATEVYWQLAPGPDSA